jgi:hypothetical protein
MPTDREREIQERATAAAERIAHRFMLDTPHVSIFTTKPADWMARVIAEEMARMLESELGDSATIPYPHAPEPLAANVSLVDVSPGRISEAIAYEWSRGGGPIEAARLARE